MFSELFLGNYSEISIKKQSCPFLSPLPIVIAIILLPDHHSSAGNKLTFKSTLGAII
jgi:hypothetical protein